MTEIEQEAIGLVRSLMRAIDDIADDMTDGYGTPFRPQEWIDAQAWLSRVEQSAAPPIQPVIAPFEDDGLRPPATAEEFTERRAVADAFLARLDRDVRDTAVDRLTAKLSTVRRP